METETQPTAVKIPVDRKYAPVPTNAGARTKSGIRARCDDQAQRQRRLRLEIPTPTCDSTTSSKSRTKRPATVWTIHSHSRSAIGRPTLRLPTMSNQVANQPAGGSRRVGSGRRHVDRQCNRQCADHEWNDINRHSRSNQPTRM